MTRLIDSTTHRPWPDDPRIMVGADGTVVGVSGRVRKPSRNPGGYLSLTIWHRGKCRTVPVHQMVASAWLGPRPKGHQVAHGNGIRTDNRASNLRWATPKGNASDKVRHGTNNDGERHGMHRLTDEAVREIRGAYAAGVTQASLARQHGVGQRTVHEAIHGITWDHIPLADVPLGTSRRSRGTDHHHAVATPELVREIRVAAANGAGAAALARRTGLSEGGVRHIIARRTWRHVA